MQIIIFIACNQKDVNIIPKIYNLVMSVNEDFRILLIKEKLTITEFARLASEQSGKKYTVFGISQKLARNSIKYDEMKFFAKVLGYDIKFEKIDE